MDIRKIAEICSFLMLLGGSLILGFMGRTTEMGLAIGAGAIGLSFLNLEQIASLKGAGIELITKDKLDKLEVLIEKETEPSYSGEEGDSVPDVSQVNSNTRAVINTLQHHEYTWRYLGGIKNDSKLTSDEIKKSLGWLIENGYAKQSLGKHGTIWNLTKDGRYLSAVIDFEHVKA